VAIIRGTQINFAVPGEKVQTLMRGRVTDVQFGEPYLENAQVKLPVQIECLDPLQRIRGLRAEVWTGKPGAGRPLSVKQPQPAAGDTVHKLVPLRYEKGKGQGEVVLPLVGGGQVVWIQPAVSDAGGSTYWASASTFTPSEFPPLQRAAAMLQQHFDTQLERTVKLNCGLKVKMNGGPVQLLFDDSMQLEALELTQADPRGGQFRLTVGSCTHTREAGGKAVPLNLQAQQLLRNKYFAFTTDGQGGLVQNDHPTLDRVYPAGLRQGFDNLVGEIANGYELTCLAVPNRLVQPRETWSARVPLVFNAGDKKEVVDLHATCTFEGTRIVQGQNQALISLTGTVRSRQPGKNAVGGKVTGKVHFAIDKGFLTRADIQMESESGQEAFFTQTLHVKLTREPGNRLGLTPAQPPSLQGPLAQAKLIHESAGSLTAQDRSDFAHKPGCFYKTTLVNLTAGHTYIVEMNDQARNIVPGQQPFDPYLVVLDPGGQKVAEDDDSGGHLNALVVLRAPATGVYQIQATTCSERNVGAFNLRVTEIVQP
jgi:hypothetical protein